MKLKRKLDAFWPRRITVHVDALPLWDALRAGDVIDWPDIDDHALAFLPGCVEIIEAVKEEYNGD